jgi:hypothetical protein
MAMFVMTFIGGVLAFRQLNIEAYPDPTAAYGRRDHPESRTLGGGD